MKATSIVLALALLMAVSVISAPTVSATDCGQATVQIACTLDSGDICIVWTDAKGCALTIFGP